MYQVFYSPKKNKGLQAPINLHAAVLFAEPIPLRKRCAPVFLALLVTLPPVPVNSSVDKSCNVMKISYFTLSKKKDNRRSNLHAAVLCVQPALLRFHRAHFFRAVRLLSFLSFRLHFCFNPKLDEKSNRSTVLHSAFFLS